MTARKLGIIYARFAGRTDRILTAFQSPLPENVAAAEICRPIHEAGAAYLVIRLQALWGEYCRNLVIISARGNALTIGGKPIPPAPGIAGFAAIRHILGNHFSGGRGTQWDNPDWAIQRANQLNPTNQSQIRSGLRIAPVDDLRVIRNFLAHPNQRTGYDYQRLAQDMGFPGAAPKELLSSPFGGGGTVIESWVADFQLAAYNAAL